MSDPVSNTEIEDVLSSIRRLVADDMRKSKDKVAEMPDRLLLTPSQRIGDRDAPEDTQPAPETVAAPQPAEPEETVDPEQAPEPEQANTAAQESNPNALKRPTEAQVDSLVWAMSGVQALSGSKMPTSVTPVSDGTPKPDAPLVLADDQPSDNDTATEQAEANPATQPDKTLERKIAALEQLVAQSQDDFDGDDVASDPAAEQDDTLEWEDAPSNDADEALMAEDAQDDIGQDRAAAQDAEIVPEAEPEAVNHTQSDEQPAPENTATAEQTRALDDAEPVTQDPSEPRQSNVRPFIVPDVPPAEDDLLADQALSLDEEALHDLVADIVRQELQGVLGERITRNVRKLVRREIHRVLVSKEFE